MFIRNGEAAGSILADVPLEDDEPEPVVPEPVVPEPEPEPVVPEPEPEPEPEPTPDESWTRDALDEYALYECDGLDTTGLPNKAAVVQAINNYN